MSDEVCENCARLTAEVQRLKGEVAPAAHTHEPCEACFCLLRERQALTAEVQRLTEAIPTMVCGLHHEEFGVTAKLAHRDGVEVWELGCAECVRLAARGQQMGAALTDLVGQVEQGHMAFEVKASSSVRESLNMARAAFLADPAGTAPPERQHVCTHCGYVAVCQEIGAAGQRAGEPTP